MTDDKKAPAKVRTVAVRVLRDHWVENPADAENPTRIRKGTVVEVPVEAALDGVETGALSRVK